MIVLFHKLADKFPRLLQLLEDPAVHRLFLQGSVKAFYHPIGLGLLDKAITDLYSPELELIAILLCGVLRANPAAALARTLP